MKKIFFLGLVFLLLVVGIALADESPTRQTNQEYCQYMLEAHQWKTVTFPENFPIENGLISIVHDGPVAYAKIENNSIVAAGCSVLTEYNYTMIISGEAAMSLVDLDNSIKEYNWWKRKGLLEIEGTDGKTKRNVRKLNRRTKFFPWMLR